MRRIRKDVEDVLVKWREVAVIVIISPLVSFLMTKYVFPALLPELAKAINSIGRGSPERATLIYVAIGLVLAIVIGLLIWSVLISIGRARMQSEGILLPVRVLAGHLKLGDKEAAQFKYIRSPIEAPYKNATHDLETYKTGASRDKQGIIITGIANSGKTRLATEVLREVLPDWYVLDWRKGYVPDDIPAKDQLQHRDIVFLVDDIQDHAIASGTVAESLYAAKSRVCSDARRAVVVATCRAEDLQRVQSNIGWVFEELSEVAIPNFEPEQDDPTSSQIISVFAENNAPHINEWDGTIGSLVLGLTRKRDNYLKLLKRPEATVLHAMKLLTEGGIYEHSEHRIRLACAKVLHDARVQSRLTWQNARQSLIQKEFVSVTEKESVSVSELESSSERRRLLVIRKDTYFTKVITGYPSSQVPNQLRDDLEKLRKVLVEDRDSSGLIDLAVTLGDAGNHQGAIDTYDAILDNDAQEADAWYNRGLELYLQKKYIEAMESFQKTVDLNPGDASAWFNLGIACEVQGRIVQALQAYQFATKSDPKKVAAWKYQILILLRSNQVEEARVTCRNALAANPDNLALSELSNQIDS